MLIFSHKEENNGSFNIHPKINVSFTPMQKLCNSNTELNLKEK